MTATDQTATLASIAETLHQAQAGATAVAQITGSTALTLADAYAVQHLLVERRTADGERLSGVKLGFTSRAKAQQMGVNDVIIGSLTTGMAARAWPRASTRARTDASSWSDSVVAARISNQAQQPSGLICRSNRARMSGGAVAIP